MSLLPWCLVSPDSCCLWHVSLEIDSCWNWDFLKSAPPPSFNMMFLLIFLSGWEDQRASDKCWRGSGDWCDSRRPEDSGGSWEHCCCHWFRQEGPAGQGKAACYLLQWLNPGYHDPNASESSHKMYTAGRTFIELLFWQTVNPGKGMSCTLYNIPDCFKFWKKTTEVNNIISAKELVTFQKEWLLSHEWSVWNSSLWK